MQSSKYKVTRAKIKKKEKEVMEFCEVRKHKTKEKKKPKENDVFSMLLLHRY